MGSKPICADEQEEKASGRQQIGWPGGELCEPDGRTPSSPPFQYEEPVAIHSRRQAFFIESKSFHGSHRVLHSLCTVRGYFYEIIVDKSTIVCLTILVLNGRSA
jgi:hypothetical protein